MLESHNDPSVPNTLTDSVTVVICAYTEDRWLTLRRTIDAALNQTRFGDEVIVVVDHNDALLAQCYEHLGDFTVVPNHHNRGLSGARNTALDAAHGSIIAFIDDDAIPLDGWLDALRAPYENTRVYGVGGLARPRWIGKQPPWFPEEFLWVVGCSHRGLPPNAHPVRNLVGANMSFRKSAFDRVGGFAEQMGRVGERLLACEETEFSIRLTQNSPEVIILYQPLSQVEHHVPQQRTSFRYFFRRCWGEGISKAEVSRRVSRSRALSAERHYTSRVLPRGIWNGLHDIATGDLWGAARSSVILLGLIATSAGYCVGTVCRTRDVTERQDFHVSA